MAPNQQPTRLIAATEMPSSVTVGAAGYGGDGRRSDASADAAMTELRSVRGSWPRDAVVVAFRKSLLEG